MSHTFYRTIKLSFGFTLAVGTAMFLSLSYPLSAGIIAILNLLDTKKDSAKVAWRRFYSSIIGLALSAMIFSFFGFHLLAIGLFLMFFIPLSVYLKAKEGIIINIVLASHLISFNSISLQHLANEILLVVIGGLVAIILNLHMPNRRKNLLSLQQSVDNQLRGLLLTISYSLRNLCTINNVEPSLKELEATIKKGKRLAYEHMNNAYFTEDRYYLEYFQMRLTQFHRLTYMREHLKMIFVIQEEALMLSDFFEHLALTYNETNDGRDLLNELSNIRNKFQEFPLPQNHLAFENRASLIQTLADAEEFIRIKLRFIEQR